ncbi:MAG: hypothetical protein H6626_09335 [Pseudobdellovibrionaceae bacterium]|nr:hypothetical protein [Bdellovibrionales bacterium]USN46418.1 MAG: hypothetical protein H6626_09335 [Pseudobdellovibrionaceae bacterium]
MIDKENIIALLREVDEQLLRLKQSAPQEIIIYGGAALISLGLISRATVDIDVFAPQIDFALESAIKNIAKRHLFDERWINSTGKAFVKELPTGWEGRASTLFEGKILRVKILGRVDLIFTKMLAELDRGEDFEDLKSLKPTKKELEKIRQPLRSLESSSAWKNKVDEIIKMLNEGDYE